jgi:hypothetical protein
MNTNKLYIQLSTCLGERSYESGREESGEKHFTYALRKNTPPHLQVGELATLLCRHKVDEVYISDDVVEEVCEEALEYVVRAHTYD